MIDEKHSSSKSSCLFNQICITWKKTNFTFQLVPIINYKTDYGGSSKYCTLDFQHLTYTLFWIFSGSLLGTEKVAGHICGFFCDHLNAQSCFIIYATLRTSGHVSFVKWKEVIQKNKIKFPRTDVFELLQLILQIKQNILILLIFLYLEEYMLNPLTPRG